MGAVGIIVVLLIAAIIAAWVDGQHHYRRRFDGYRARVELHSISRAGVEVITMVWRYWYAIHAEVMTYRMAARNAASKRAIPTHRLLLQVLLHPAGPVWYGRNQPRMIAEHELSGVALHVAITLWYSLRFPAVATAWLVSMLPLHKQVVNRMIEPWTWMEIAITGNPGLYESVFKQRIHPAAQPEFRYLAGLASGAIHDSVPTQRSMHTPFIRSDDGESLLKYVVETGHDPTLLLGYVSAARVARVSYLNHEGTREVAKDLRLARDLREADPVHGSPWEQVLVESPCPTRRSGPFVGWVPLREHVDPDHRARMSIVGCDCPGEHFEVEELAALTGVVVQPPSCMT